MVTLEQEVASIIRFILDATKSLTPYYWQLKEDFAVPSVYFPEPVFTSRGDTFNTYALEYSWLVTFFASTNAEAQATQRPPSMLYARRGGSSLSSTSLGSPRARG